MTTDMGLGCFYITDLTTNKTTSHTHSTRAESGADLNKLKDATDVFADPAGNIVVATCSGKDASGNDVRGDLELFTPNGAYVMPIRGVDVIKPVGLLSERKNLYVVDVRTKIVELYSLCESPKKSSPLKSPSKKK